MVVGYPKSDLPLTGRGVPQPLREPGHHSRARLDGGAGNLSRGTRGEDPERPCAGRSLLLVAAEEARVRTGRGRGRCTTETADSDDLSADDDVVGTLSPVLAHL